MIHQACRKGELQEVGRLLTETPALIDQDDEHRWRPLFHAAYRKHLDVVRLLLEHGADISAHNGDALHYASEVPENMNVVELLVKHGAVVAHVQPKNALSLQLHHAIFLADAGRVAGLLRRSSELATQIDGRGSTPLHHAARCGLIEITSLLLEAGADVHATNPGGHTVLYCAGGHGHLQTVKLLLDSGADASVKFTHDGKTLLEWLGQFPNDKRLQRVAALL